MSLLQVGMKMVFSSDSLFGTSIYVFFALFISIISQALWLIVIIKYRKVRAFLGYYLIFVSFLITVILLPWSIDLLDNDPLTFREARVFIILGIIPAIIITFLTGLFL